MRKQASRYFPTTSDRVSQHTSDIVNQKILAKMEASISRYVNDRGAIAHRLRDLEYEWDIERALEALSAGSIAGGFLLGRSIDRRWHWLSGLVGGFLLQHSLFGWSVPAMMLRNLGFRTAREIESERAALKALRGDFEEADADHVSARNLLLAADPSFYY